MGLTVVTIGDGADDGDMVIAGATMARKRFNMRQLVPCTISDRKSP
jgi:hypothetical protein